MSRTDGKPSTLAVNKTLKSSGYLARPDFMRIRAAQPQPNTITGSNRHATYSGKIELIPINSEIARPLLGIKSLSMYRLSWNISFVTSFIFDVYPFDAGPLYLSQFFLTSLY
jgi:hypothetical protein